MLCCILSSFHFLVCLLLYYNCKLYRYKNYGLKASQCTPATANCLPSAPPDRALIADQIDNSSYTTFNYTAGTLQSFSLLQVDFNFKQGSEALLMRHEIQVRNAP